MELTDKSTILMKTHVKHRKSLISKTKSDLICRSGNQSTTSLYQIVRRISKNGSKSLFIHSEKMSAKLSE